MKSSKLDNKQSELLEKILNRRAPSQVFNYPHLSPNEIEEICSLIVDELSEFGLNSDEEPNQLGLELEELIDRLRRNIL